MSTELRWCYVTAPSEDEARQLARTLVTERLAACANVFPGVRSFYWWQGEVQEDAECVLVLKTRADRVAALTARVRALHSYTVPCVVALPILEGNPDYLRWLEAEAREPGGAGDEGAG